jgi:hypothetical protein
MRVFLVKLRGLASELRDGGHRVVARECREVDGRVAEFVNFRVVVALPGGLADAGYLFLHAFRAPCRGVFLQVIGVFHGIAVFDKIRKIIRSPPLSGRIYFLFRRPLRASLLSGTASGILFRRGRAVSGAFRNGICGRLRSRLCESCRTWRPGDTSGGVGMAPRSHVRDRSIHIRVGGRVLLRNRLPPHIALSSYFRLFLRLGFPADGRPVALYSCRHPFPAALSLFLRMRFPAKREPGPRRSGLFRSGDSPPLPNYFFSAFRFTSLAAFLASSGFFDVALLS